MFASLSIESAISAVTAEHKFSAASLAAIDGGISSPTLSKVLAGQSRLSPDKEESLKLTLEAIRQLIDEFPVPIDFNQVVRVKPLIDQRRAQIRENIDPIVHRCLLIRISGTGFFLTMRGGEVVTTPSETLAAAFENPDTANEVIRQLAKLGAKAWIDSFGAFRRKSTMSHSLMEVGFTPEPATAAVEEPA
ncbi:MAG: hypothetical protein JWO71_2476 [Candidatus Acidoferrum typicum]|nr:hypothetical protein [Candidatus Acidoferrum typicum]